MATYVPNPPAEPIWLGSPSAGILLTLAAAVPAPAKPAQWRYDQVEPPSWVGASQPSALLARLLTAGGQVPAYPWRFNTAEEIFWLARPQASALLASLLTAGGQAKPARWNFDYDHGPQFWAGVPLASPRALNSPATATKPFAGGFWHYDHVELPRWMGAPVAASPLLFKPSPYATFPFSLFALQAGYNEQPEDNLLPFQPETGAPIIRRRMSLSQNLITFVVPLSSANWHILKTFYRSTLKNGTLPFIMPHPRTGTSATWAWVPGSPPKVNQAYGLTFEIVFTLRLISGGVLPITLDFILGSPLLFDNNPADAIMVE